MTEDEKQKIIKIAKENPNMFRFFIVGVPFPKSEHITEKVKNEIRSGVEKFFQIDNQLMLLCPAEEIISQDIYLDHLFTYIKEAIKQGKSKRKVLREQ